ncbi:MAG: signal peptide peptidase SppA [Bacteroidales bacterium]|nr:signal peptide peptidase SppA [Bacteroidales bacterium]
MKDFGKMLLAVICGLLIVQIIKYILLFMFLGSLSAMGSGPSKVLPKEGVLDMNLSEIQLNEQPADMAMPALSLSGFNMQVAPVGLRDAVKAIETAAADPGVKYILLRPDNVNAGMADLEELRHALKEFRRSGKAVVAYTENPGNGSYYLSTVADKIYMANLKGGTYQLVGVSATMLFLKDILDKLGVNVQLIRHGKYKSAGEMYIRSSSSAENREQNQVMINSAWHNICAEITASRDISEEDFNKLIDNLSLVFPEDFLQAGLVDELMDHEALLDKLCTLAQVSDSKDLKLIPFADYVNAHKDLGLPGRSNVAIIYADGDIVEGKGFEGVAGDRFVKIIDDVRKDATVKAVVLRVNSPGGSVSASEKIRAALALLQEEKPLVASYGNYAASGGYWISSGCQKVYSNANTITGSIGVFSMIPEFSKTTRKFGVTVETVGSNKHSDIFSLMRPFDAKETAYMQASVEDIYNSFVNIVAEGRSLEPARVDQIAQGRVWVGSDAHSISLVDEIGTLEDAIVYAAGLAGLHTKADYRVVSFPKPLTVAQQMMMAFGQSDEEPTILSDTPFKALGTAVDQLTSNKPSAVYARIPYDLHIQ